MHRSFLPRCLLFARDRAGNTADRRRRSGSRRPGHRPEVGKLEVELQGPTSVGLSDTSNPFLIEVTATFSGPGASFAVPAFYAATAQAGWTEMFGGPASHPTPSATGRCPPVASIRSSTVIAPPFRSKIRPPATLASQVSCPISSVRAAFSTPRTSISSSPMEPSGSRGRSTTLRTSWRLARTAGFPTKAEAIQYLATERLNSLYFMTNNTGGDRDNVWPWVENVTPNTSTSPSSTAGI